VGVLVTVLLAVLALPWLLAKTPLRNWLLAMIVNDDELSIESQDASFGYLSPLSLDGLKVVSRNGATRLGVTRIEADKSWLGMLVSRPQLGTFRFIAPQADLLINERPAAAAPVEPAPSSGLPDLPALVAEIRDASIIVRTRAEGPPPIALDKIGLTIRVERQADDSVLRIDPTTVFDHAPITPQLCGQGLQLVAPLLADEISADGEFSLRLSEFHVPLGDPQPGGAGVRIAGQLHLHRANVAVKHTIATKIVALVLQIIGGSLPETMVVAEGVEVDFQVIEGRFHHQGLALLLPRGDSAIGIRSDGSVGLDETLDLQVSIELPAGMLGSGPLAQRLTGEPLVLTIGGTLDTPTVGLASNGGWAESIQRVIKASGGEAPTGSLEDAVIDLIGGLLQERSPEHSGRLLDRLRGMRPEQPPDAAPPDAAPPDAASGNDEAAEPGRPLFPRLRERRSGRQPTPL
jgi:hypothetical protein